jgi:hypothetical protein
MAHAPEVDHIAIRTKAGRFLYQRGFVAISSSISSPRIATRAMRLRAGGSPDDRGEQCWQFPLNGIAPCFMDG